ncbi:TPA: molybdopterin-binding protein, partial [Neisseria meningitidis]
MGRGYRQQALSKRCLKNASSTLSLTLSHGRGNKSQHHRHFQTASVKKPSMNAFNLIIIGDEILHGSSQDKHFAFFKSLLESKGLKLNQVQYLPDEPDLLVRQLRRSFSD